MILGVVIGTLSSIFIAAPIAYPVSYTHLGDTLLVVNNHLESNKRTEKDKEVYREMMKDPDKPVSYTHLH